MLDSTLIQGKAVRRLAWLSMIIVVIMVGAVTSKSATPPAQPVVSINVMEMQKQSAALPVMVIENPV
jgi:hypothetical protein